jgi:hypothetical protein
MLNLRRTSLARVTSLAGFLLLSTSVGPAAMADPGEAFPACEELADFDDADFTDSTNIDNEWFPLVPGMQFVLQGFSNRGGGELDHTVTFTVTDRTWVINGVETRVVLDEDVNDGELVEQELAFFAQDGDWNVWSLGEYPEEVDEETGAMVTPSVWFAGEGEEEPAQAGVLVPGDPHLGSRWHIQGWAPEVDFLDCAKVFKMGRTLSIPIETSEELTNCANGDLCEDVMVAKERSPLEHEGGLQLKYYAPGVGLVQVGAVGDKENETLVLVELRNINFPPVNPERLRVHTKVNELFHNACTAGFDVLCP